MSTADPANKMETLMELLLRQYQEKPLGEAGHPPSPAPLDDLYEKLRELANRSDMPSSSYVDVARMALKHFLEASQHFLKENPPKQQIMLAQGFGVILGDGGYEVALSPPETDDPGSIDPAGEVAITTPRSVRGRHGIDHQNSGQVPVTGAGPDYTIRHG
jgi:hypothetical protein